MTSSGMWEMAYPAGQHKQQRHVQQGRGTLGSLHSRGQVCERVTSRSMLSVQKEMK